MKKIIYAYLTISLLTLSPACQRMVEEEAPSHTLTAYLEGEPDTKTHLSEADAQGIYYPYWSKGDALALYADNINRPDTYTLSGGEGTVKGTFKGTLSGKRMVALYPASDKTDEGLRDNVLTLELPAVQQYAPGSFGPGAFPMVAVSTDGNLSFKNLCAVLKVSLTGQEQVRSIKFIPSDGWMAVSGKATVRTDFTGLPELVMSDDGANEVTLECGSVDLNASTPTDFFLVIPAGTYVGGFTLEIQTFHGLVTRSTQKDVTFGRSQFRSIPAFECVGSGEIDPDHLPYNQIWYKTKDDVLHSFQSGAFDAAIVSHQKEGDWFVITFDGPVTAIGDEAFAYDYFTDVHLPDCVQSLGRYTFYYNPYLTSFKTPESLSSVGYLAFGYCSSLSRFYGKHATEDGRFIMLSDGLLAANAPGGMSETVTLPENTVTVAGSLFYEDKTVRNIIVPEGVKSIGDGFFIRSQVLETATLPSTLESISSSAFYFCNNLKAFKGDSQMIWSDGLALVSLGGEILKFIGWDVEDYVMPEGITELGSSCFNSLPKLKSITFPSTLSGLWSGWKWNCPQLEYFYGPGTSADHHCLVMRNQLDAVTSILPSDYSIPDDMGILSIFYDVFSQNSSVVNLTIPDEVVNLRACFANMENLKSIRMPASLQYIEENAFWGSMALEAIYLRSFAPPSYSDSDEDWRKWGADHLVIYVPEGYEEQYKAAPGWSKYADRIQGLFYDDLENPDYYMSTDYSRDGEVVTLQTASEGNGIDVVLMGDAYSDRQIEDGTYDAAMHKMMDAFFSEEPYTSYQNLFNVYAVTVVSATEGYDHGGQALSTYFGSGTQVGGNDNKCIQYAQKILSDERVDNALIIVAMNRDYYAGTCWMYYPSGGDYGCGLSVAYFPTSSDNDTFKGLVRHEAGGHGFAKLADEYAYENMGAIPQAEIDNRNRNVPYGWWKNADFTGDPTEVKWAHFLADERYRYDGLGCFEGAFTYWKGAWRPTDVSIMRYNTGGFNAPSREAIWYRMHKLAYGEGWVYNYEDFVSYDALNRKTSAGAPAAARRNYVERPMEPTHAPVVVPRRWNEPASREHDSSRVSTPLR